MVKNVSIIGCGWLGTPLAIELSKKGYDVKGTSRSAAVNESLEAEGIETYIFDAEKNQVPSDLVTGCDIAIITLPPNKFSSQRAYIEGLYRIAERFSKATVVIYTSSIGIYPKITGSFTETYSFSEEETPSTLYLAENALRTILGDRLTVLRLGGLIGGARHPIKSLSGKVLNSDGNEPVHLIHRNDVINLILFLLNTDHPADQIYNVAYPVQVSKKEYYALMADRLSVPPPLFNGNESVQRHISVEKLEKMKDFSLICNPLDFIFGGNQH